MSRKNSPLPLRGNMQAGTSKGADADAARVRALAAYKDFLTLWKDADPDIPILKEAKAEYAKLQ
jgi:eukaryotic-like serine/threonine-protein kinase